MNEKLKNLVDRTKLSISYFVGMSMLQKNNVFLFSDLFYLFFFSFQEFTTTCDVLHYHVLFAFWFICGGLLDILSYPTRHSTR